MGSGPANWVGSLVPPRSQPHSRETLDLLRELERAGVPFRRAYADDPFHFSAAGQLPSILVAAGGRPHSSPTRTGGTDLWTVGIDLGHALGSETSRLVMTLIDPHGALAGAWYTHQRRDETAREDSLARLLVCCRERLAELDADARVLVLRDGRMFEHERIDLYAPYFPNGLTFVEFRKGHNPQIVFAEPHPHAPGKPLATVVPGMSTMLLTTVAARGQGKLPSIAKVVASPRANGLGLDLAEIAGVLASSSAAPSLGLWPHHLPAAIYWADGIAGKSDTDLRFWGTPAQCVD